MNSNNESARPNTLPDWLMGGGHMGELIRSMDWSGTPLGPRANWPQTLRVITNVVLSSTFPMAIHWGEDLIFIYNDAYRTIAGGKHPHAMGRSTRDVWPEVWNFNRPIFEQVMLQGRTVHLEDQLFRINRSGHPEDAFFTLSCSPIRMEDGRVGGALVTLVETTRRILADRALQNSRDELEKQVGMRTAELLESEEKFRSLVETTSDWIWEVDANGVYTYASPQVRDLLGYEPEEVLGRKPFEFMPPEESTRVMNEFFRIVKDRKGCAGLENVNIRKDGRLVVLETSCVQRLDAKGNLLGYRGIDRDITERKHAEALLRKSRDNLELRVQERTAELERRNQELQNFTYAASHDLQEPLRKIQILSDFFAGKYCDSLGDEARDYMRRIQETATRMRNVLHSLLSYSRLTFKSEPFHRVRLNEIVREVVSDLELQIRETGARVDIGDLPEVEADAAQMRQLFQNVLGNALKFHREGIQPVVKIHSDCSSKRGECKICIEDNGIGFEERYLEQIFKPFQRLHGKDLYGGIGMGLTICAKVIERHNGRLTARSTPGQGSTFIVTLPVRQTKS